MGLGSQGREVAVVVLDTIHNWSVTTGIPDIDACEAQHCLRQVVRKTFQLFGQEAVLSPARLLHRNSAAGSEPQVLQPLQRNTPAHTPTQYTNAVHQVRGPSCGASSFLARAGAFTASGPGLCLLSEGILDLLLGYPDLVRRTII